MSHLNLGSADAGLRSAGPNSRTKSLPDPAPLSDPAHGGGRVSVEYAGAVKTFELEPEQALTNKMLRESFSLMSGCTIQLQRISDGEIVPASALCPGDSVTLVALRRSTRRGRDKRGTVIDSVYHAEGQGSARAEAALGADTESLGAIGVTVADSLSTGQPASLPLPTASAAAAAEELAHEVETDESVAASILEEFEQALDSITVGSALDSLLLQSESEESLHCLSRSSARGTRGSTKSNFTSSTGSLCSRDNLDADLTVAADFVMPVAITLQRDADDAVGFGFRCRNLVVSDSHVLTFDDTKQRALEHYYDRLATSDEQKKQAQRLSQEVTRLTLTEDPAGSFESAEVFVESVVPNGPAAQAGLDTGDRILTIGKQSVSGMSAPDVNALLASFAAGDSVQISVSAVDQDRMEARMLTLEPVDDGEAHSPAHELSDDDAPPGSESDAESARALSPTSRKHKLMSFFGERVPNITLPLEATAIDTVGPITYEGPLSRKIVVSADGKKNRKRNWKQVYGKLRGQVLYFYDHNANQQSHRPRQGRMSVKAAICDIHYSKKRKHVFRVVSLLGAEYQLQAESEASMMAWIQHIQEQSVAGDDDTDVDHHDLIKRMASSTFQSSSEKLKSPESPGGSPSASSKQLTPNSLRHKLSATSLLPKFRRRSSEALVGGVPFVKMGIAEMCRKYETEVPLLVSKCVHEVERRGLDVKGIYRLAASHSGVARLREAFCRTPKLLDLSDTEAWEDIHAICGVLKSYIRDVEEPLLTVEAYDRFIEHARLSDRRERMMRIKAEVLGLPPTHLATLRFLIRHLHRVSQNSEDNKMHLRNIAIVFGPTLVRSGAENVLSMVSDMSSQCLIVESLIEHFTEIFSQDEGEPGADAKSDTVLPAEAGRGTALSNVTEVRSSRTSSPANTVSLPGAEVDDVDSMEVPFMAPEEVAVAIAQLYADVQQDHAEPGDAALVVATTDAAGGAATTTNVGEDDPVAAPEPDTQSQAADTPAEAEARGDPGGPGETGTAQQTEAAQDRASWMLAEFDRAAAEISRGQGSQPLLQHTPPRDAEWEPRTPPRPSAMSAPSSRAQTPEHGSPLDGPARRAGSVCSLGAGSAGSGSPSPGYDSPLGAAQPRASLSTLPAVPSPMSPNRAARRSADTLDSRAPQQSSPRGREAYQLVLDRQPAAPTARADLGGRRRSLTRSLSAGGRAPSQRETEGDYGGVLERGFPQRTSGPTHVGAPYTTLRTPSFEDSPLHGPRQPTLWRGPAYPSGARSADWGRPAGGHRRSSSSGEELLRARFTDDGGPALPQQQRQPPPPQDRTEGATAAAAVRRPQPAEVVYLMKRMPGPETIL